MDIPAAVAIPDRVALVTPPSIFLLDERVFPNLGILKVAAVLEEKGVAVDLLDLSGIENYEDAMAGYLASSEVKHVGITTTTPQMPATTRLINAIRRSRDDVKVILGGPHVTLVSSAAKLEAKSGASGRGTRALGELMRLTDVLVSGDGEQAIFRCFGEGAEKLIDADDPATGMFMTDDMYDQSPWPSRHLIDVESYKYAIEDRASTSLIAQLGCPFQCGFCGGRNSKSLRKIRVRTTENIVAEMEFLHREFGYTGFMFYDDELNVNKQMLNLMQEIINLQERLGVEFRLRGFVKAELFNELQARAMYSAGFRWLLTGFESGSPRILQNINKRATREDNTRAAEFVHAAGLKVKALMSIGHPGESEATIAEMRDWLLETRPDDFDCTVITTYPGTPYYDEAVPHDSIPGVYTYTYKKTGDRLHAYDLDYNQTADYYKGDPDGGYKSYVFTDNVSSTELVRLRDWVERSVREELGIEFNPTRAAMRYEHSMGLGSDLPDFILRTSGVTAASS